MKFEVDVIENNGEIKTLFTNQLTVTIVGPIFTDEEGDYLIPWHRIVTVNSKQYGTLARQLRLPMCNLP